MKRIIKSKISYRLLALLLSVSVLVSNFTTISFAAEGEVLDTAPATDGVETPLCGMDEHTHDPTCYVVSGEQVCTLPEDTDHEHVATCYAYEENALLCDKAESKGHSHGETCYTETTERVCGKEETEGHTHVGTCYTDSIVVGCGKEETEGHAHGEACFTTATVVGCGKEETAGHSHGTECYGAKSVQVCTDTSEEHVHGEGCFAYPLVCTLPVVEAHTHTEACNKVETTLTCTLPEVEAHQHTEECNKTEQSLICQLEEVEPHSHSTDCNGVVKTLSCTTEESEGHTHGEACYGTKETLICGKHRHGDECFVETKSLICELTEHSHSEECWPKEEKPEAPEEPEEPEEPEVPEEEPVRISGELPEGANVSSTALSAEEVCALISLGENEELLFAYDISILTEGGAYQPKDEGKSVTVTVEAPVELADDQHIAVYHVLTDGSIEEKHCTDNGDGTVSFEADSFSVYIGSVVTATSVYLTPGVGYNFYNSAGTALTHSYVVWKNNLTIKVKPDIGYTITSVTVYESVDPAVESDADTVTENADGTYTITFNNPTKNQIIKVETAKDGAPTGNFIYFDLAAGNVTIIGNSYTGSRYDETGTAKEFSGTLQEGESYYVYQSGKEKVAQALTEAPTLPTHDRVPHPTVSELYWKDYIKNNDDVDAVISAWKNYYSNQSEREYTGNWIKVTGKVDATIVIDSLWSSHHTENTGRHDGGLSFRPGTTGADLTIYAKGDNRFGNIYYCSNSSYGDKEQIVALNHLIIDGDSDSTLTVANFKTDKDIGNDTTNTNYWCAAIGANDSEDHVKGIVINGGNIYAGTTPKDDCTAIGGGGNGFGIITINGGTVTAVSSSSGAAIGGGIGKSSPGGSALVTINGGYVYAYNFSSPITSGNSTYTNYSTDKVYAIPAAAIGGGSSGKSSGNAFTKVVITGGEVHAQSVGGAAIGGGSSGDIKGGDAIVTISGGLVYAKSISGTVKDKNGVEHTIQAGAAIGGGTGGWGGGENASAGQGGSATVTITGGTVYTGSIGGGATNNPVGRAGFASVSIDGGTVYGQVIMGEVGDGTTKCTFDMTGGMLSNTQTSIPTGHEAYSAAAYNYKYPNGGAVYMDDPIGEATVDDGRITGCSATLGGAVYMTAGKFTMNGGSIGASSAQSGGAVYMTAGEFTMNGGTIASNSAAQNGGAVYIGKTDTLSGLFTMTGGNIMGNTASGDGGGIYLDGGNAFIKGSTQIDGVYSGGSIGGNGATNGGGAYLNAGNLTISEYGAIDNNNASNDGGGAYLNDGNLKILDNASLSSNTAAQRGGGAFVNNGNIVMNGGNVDGNTATSGNGGGMYVSAKDKAVYVDVYSGSVSNNRSPNGTGGAFAVVGNEATPRKIDVNIGVNHNHFGGSASVQHGFTHECVHEEGVNYTHKSCPIVSDNYSGETGGAIYISGFSTGDAATSLNLYCVTAQKNRSANNLSDFMRVDGGKVLISSANNNNSDVDISDENDRYHGNTIITDSLHVVGGQVDLYGNMENPSFDNSTLEPDDPPNSITVDVKADSSDYFKDHRYAEPDSYYKILYFANYDDGGEASIKYKSYQMKVGGTHTIMPALFIRSGYTIKGWNTVANPTADNPGNEYEVSQVYKVNDDLPGANTEANELILYAQWEISGYEVRFHRNEPAGASFTGDTPQIQRINHNVETPLASNPYSVIGYMFAGWNTLPAPTTEIPGTSYSDGQSVTNLTTGTGVVDLYAQWKVCDHSDPNYYDYWLENDGATLCRSCKCGASDGRIELVDPNATYNGSAQPAKVNVYNWDSPPAVTYSATELINAGTYTASVKAPVGDTIASLTYVIAQATQPAPEKVEYGVSGNTLTVSSPAAGEATVYGTKPQYKLIYYKGDEPGEIGWQPSATFTLDKSYTTYRVYARYDGNTNYLPSDATAAAEPYYNIGSAKIQIVEDAGIDHVAMGAGAGVDNGLKIVVSPEEGYRLDNVQFAISYDEGVPATEKEIQIAPVAGGSDEDGSQQYHIYNIQVDAVITITGAKLDLKIDASVAEGEVFGDLTHDDSVVISNDSAFTALYNVKSFSTTEYSKLELRFSTALPQGSTVIMLDKDKGTYWYHAVPAGGVSALDINSFIPMNGTAPVVSDDRRDYELQFVVDFSGSASGCASDPLSASLVAVADDAANNRSASVNVSFGAVSFGLTKAESTTAKQLSSTLNYTYSTNGADASKWDNRNTALVLTPTGNASLPADAVILATVGGVTTKCFKNAQGTFIVPLTLLGAGNSVDLTLSSGMLPVEAVPYTFKAEWRVSRSLAGAAPINGNSVATLETITFEKAADAKPSLKITGETVTKADTLALKIATNIQFNGDYDVTIYVDRKENKDYVYSAQHEEVTSAGDFNIPLGGFATLPGSYRLRVVVTRGFETVLEMPYYFVIEESGSGTAAAAAEASTG